MASSDVKARLAPAAQAKARPLTTLVLSVGLFLLLDAMLFRTGLYARIEAPRTPAGSMMSIIHFTTAVAADPKRDVLVMGNSRIEYGFSVRYVDEAFPNSPYRMVLGAFPASTEEFWYYALCRIDPRRDRYAAIVIPMPGYGVPPRADDYSNHYETAQILAPIVPVARLGEFLEGFDDPGLRWRAAILALFPSHDYASDLQDFLLHPAARLRDVRERNQVGIKYLYDEDGYPTTMEDLKIDPKTNSIVKFPERFNILFQNEMNQQFVVPQPDLARQWTSRNAAYEAKWLGKIVADYKDSKTRLIFIDVPHRPVSLPAQQPIPGAPDIYQMIPSYPNVTILPQDTFEWLQRPHYFLDMNHMNVFGKKAFSVQLGQAVIDVLSGKPIHQAGH